MAAKLALVWRTAQVFISECLAAFVAFLPVFLLTAPLGLLGPAVHGLAVYVGIWLSFPTGGGHITPMVTLAALLTKRIHPAMTAVYLVGQFAGTLTGMGVGLLLTPSTLTPNAGLTLPGPAVSSGSAVVAEIVATFLLITVFLASLDEFRGAGWKLENGTALCAAIGMTVLLNATLFGPISGASMNPTRSLSAAIIQGNYESVWIYFVGPPIGSLLATFYYEILVSPSASLKRTRTWLCAIKSFDRTDTYEKERIELE